MFNSSLLTLIFVSDFAGEGGGVFIEFFTYLCLALTIFHNYLNKSPNAVPPYKNLLCSHSLLSHYVYEYIYMHKK